MPRNSRDARARTWALALLCVLVAAGGALLIGIPSAQAMPYDKREDPISHSVCQRHSHAWLVRHNVVACLHPTKAVTKHAAKHSTKHVAHSLKPAAKPAVKPAKHPTPHATPTPSATSSGFHVSPDVITPSGASSATVPADDPKFRRTTNNGKHKGRPSVSDSPPGRSPTPPAKSGPETSSGAPVPTGPGGQPLASVSPEIALQTAPMGGLQLHGGDAAPGQPAPSSAPSSSRGRTPSTARPAPDRDVAKLLGAPASPVLGIDSPVLLAGEVGLFAVTVGTMVAIAGHRRRNH